MSYYGLALYGRAYWQGKEKGATSFVVAPCGKPRRGVCLPADVHNMLGTLWHRDNVTGHLTFIRKCPVCGGTHRPKEVK